MSGNTTISQGFRCEQYFNAMTNSCGEKSGHNTTVLDCLQTHCDHYLFCFVLNCDSGFTRLKAVSDLAQLVACCTSEQCRVPSDGTDSRPLPHIRQPVSCPNRGGQSRPHLCGPVRTCAETTHLSGGETIDHREDIQRKKSKLKLHTCSKSGQEPYENAKNGSKISKRPQK